MLFQGGEQCECDPKTIKIYFQSRNYGEPRLALKKRENKNGENERGVAMTFMEELGGCLGRLVGIVLGWGVLALLLLALASFCSRI